MNVKIFHLFINFLTIDILKKRIHCKTKYFDAIVKLKPTKIPFSTDLGDGDEFESIDITP